jgi:hypothetical protein
MRVRENPFASRFVRPGALPFLSPDGGAGQDVDRIIGRLASFAWRGAIVGPHGSGKSTLIAELSAELYRREFDVQQVGAGNSLGSTLQLPTPHPATARKSILLVDGFDGLSPWRRWLVRRRCRRGGGGLIVTGHAQGLCNLSYLGLPMLVQTFTNAKLAERIVASLAGATYAAVVHDKVCESLARHGGNLREVLFDLYDLYERQARHERTEDRMPAVQSS